MGAFHVVLQVLTIIPRTLKRRPRIRNITSTKIDYNMLRYGSLATATSNIFKEWNLPPRATNHDLNFSSALRQPRRAFLPSFQSSQMQPQSMSHPLWLHKPHGRLSPSCFNFSSFSYLHCRDSPANVSSPISFHFKYSHYNGWNTNLGSFGQHSAQAGTRPPCPLLAGPFSTFHLCPFNTGNLGGCELPFVGDLQSCFGLCVPFPTWM